MSRIYEALQRAGLERKFEQQSEVAELPGLVAMPDVVLPDADKPRPAKSDVVFEHIAQHPWKPTMTSFPALADRGTGIEQFRKLRSRLYQHRYEAPLKTILVCSGMPAEGKSFVTANLAMSLARNNVNNILLIDGDLRRPTLSRFLGAPDSPGLSEYLSGTATVDDILQRDSGHAAGDGSSVLNVSNLTFIPSGKCGDNSSELVANHRIEELVSTLAPHFDWILIDSPPVLAVTDAVDIASAADAVLLVARGDKTPFDVAQRTQAAFKNSRILGFVLNDVKELPRGGSYNYYYGGNEDGVTKGRKDKRSQG
jgi:capsular exopolysaccharide synthesis family protein